MCFYRNGKINSFVLEELSKARRFLEDETPTCNPDESKIVSSYFEDVDLYSKQTKQPAIEVSARDFLASLSRIIQVSDDYFRRMFENDTLSRDNLLKYLEMGVLESFNSMNVQCLLPRIDQNLLHTPVCLQTNQTNISTIQGESESRKPISTEVIKALSQQLLREEKIGVRETIVSTLGAIGKPDA